MIKQERRFRPRKEFKFWLYHDLPDQVRLMEYIGYLRKTRQFATIIRNGLRLMWTLSEGNTSVLAELFPGIVASLKASAAPPPPPDTSNLERKIEQLQQAFLSGGAGSPNGVAMLPATAGGMVGSGMTGKAIAGAGAIAMPTFDDDDDQDTVIITKADPAQVAEQWLANMLAFAEKPPDIVTSAAPLNLRQSAKRNDDDDLVMKRAVQ